MILLEVLYQVSLTHLYNFSIILFLCSLSILGAQLILLLLLLLFYMIIIMSSIINHLTCFLKPSLKSQVPGHPTLIITNSYSQQSTKSVIFLCFSTLNFICDLCKIPKLKLKYYHGFLPDCTLKTPWDDFSPNAQGPSQTKLNQNF